MGGRLMNKLGLAILFSATACAQDLDRVFHLKNVTDATSLQEFVATMRTVAQIQQVSVDDATATLNVKGTADQIALAEWLVPRLDVAVAGSDPSAPQEYRVARNDDDVVVVYQLAHTATKPGGQEILTNLRTVGDIQKTYMIHAGRIVTVRGNANQIAMAKFLLSELDQPSQSRESPTVHQFHSNGGGGGRGDDTLVVYGLAHTDNVRSLQDILTTLRTVLEVQKIYQVSGPKLLAFRDTASAAPMVEWLIAELDRQTANAGGNEARMPGGKDDVVHVFYLSHLTSMQDINSLDLSLRKTAQIMRCYVHGVPPVIVARGTADQIAMAGQMIASSDKPDR
jgi:hypothetical protein